MNLYLPSKIFSHSCVTLQELKANLIKFVKDLSGCHLQNVLRLDGLRKPHRENKPSVRL